MDFIKLSSNDRVTSGLSAMIESVMGPHEIVQTFVPIEWALFIAQVARHAPDRPEWFPLGKWGTIQAIEDRISNDLDKLSFVEPPPPAESLAA
jgi:hypothetical protein